MGFCQWFRHFSDKINVLKLLKLKLIVLVFKQHGSQSKKYGVYQAFDHKRYQWYEFEDSPSFWTKLVNIEGKTLKIRSQLLKKVHYKTCEKIKIIEVLCMKENN